RRGVRDLRGRGSPADRGRVRQPPRARLLRAAQLPARRRRSARARAPAGLTRLEDGVRRTGRCRGGSRPAQRPTARAAAATTTVNQARLVAPRRLYGGATGFASAGAGATLSNRGGSRQPGRARIGRL